MVFRSNIWVKSKLPWDAPVLVDDSTPAGEVRLGVYADKNGQPGNLLLDAGKAIVTNGWVSIANLNLAVSQNAYYWLVYNLQSSNGIRYLSGQPSGSHVWGSAAYGVLPSTFPPIKYTNNAQYVMRASVR